MTADGDRHSKVGNRPQVARTPEEVAAIEARNALLQFDRLRQLIEEAVAPSAGFRLRPSDLLELNRLAIENLNDGAGTYRNAPIEIGQSKHTPPDWPKVARLVEDMCEYVNTNGSASAVHLAAYVMWRLNWIHPYPDGNGRTTRAASYLTLCARLGYAVPGTKTIPEIIAENKQPYYDALEKGDQRWAQGHVDVGAMESVLDNALASQLASVLDDARDPRKGTPIPVATTPGVRATVVPAASERKSMWSRQPRKIRIGAILSAIGIVITVAWQLLINWDNTQVKEVRDSVIGILQDAPDQSEPAPAAADKRSARDR